MRLLRPVLLLLALAFVPGCVVAPHPPHLRHGYAYGHGGPPRHYGPPPGHWGHGPPRHWHRPHWHGYR